MNNQHISTTYTVRLWAGIFIITGLLFGASLAGAQQMPERHWSLWLGGGGLTEPVYPGSDALYLSPVPFIQAEYTLGSFDLFAGMIDGIGVRFHVPDFAGFSLSLAVNPLGHKRDPELKDVKKFMLKNVDDVKNMLKGTPTVTNAVEVFGTLAVEVLPFATISSTVSYLPTKADYTSKAYSDKDYDGMTVSVDVQAGYPLMPQMFLQGEAGVTWMNDAYAEAFHGVVYPTSKLKRFIAENGVSDVYGSLTLINFFTEHVGVLAVGSGTLLLGDAADSPLTKETFQPQVGLIAFYNF